MSSVGACVGSSPAGQVGVGWAKLGAITTTTPLRNTRFPQPAIVSRLENASAARRRGRLGTAGQNRGGGRVAAGSHGSAALSGSVQAGRRQPLVYKRQRQLQQLLAGRPAAPLTSKLQRIVVAAALLVN